MKAVILLVALVACAHICQAVAVSTQSTVELKGSSSVVSKPQCCLKCGGGCYDAGNQQRYVSMTAIAKAAADSKAQICKPATKCPVLNAAKLWDSNTYQLVKKYNQFSLVNAAKAYNKGATGVFQQYSGLSLSNSSLALTSGLLDFQSKDTWFTASSASLNLTTAQVRGSLRSWATKNSTLAFDRCQVDLVNTVVNAEGSTWSIKDTGFNVNWTQAAVPAGPKFVGSYPFLALNSRIELTRGVITLLNVKDAYIVKSALKGKDVQLVLINSNLRLIDSTLDLDNIALKLENSSVLLSKVKMVTDRFVSLATGALTGLPKTTAPFKDLGSTPVTIKGTGKFIIKSVNK